MSWRSVCVVYVSTRVSMRAARSARMVWRVVRMELMMLLLVLLLLLPFSAWMTVVASLAIELVLKLDG